MGMRDCRLYTFVNYIVMHAENGIHIEHGVIYGLIAP
jgi:hypothetical protein